LGLSQLFEDSVQPVKILSYNAYAAGGSRVAGVPMQADLGALFSSIG
jgi:hypothetical protein